MKFILGRKLNMTQIFDKDGLVQPATIVEASPIVVTQVKTKETDGYAAVQVATGSKNPNRVNKAMKGHMKDLGVYSDLREFRDFSTDAAPAQKVGDKIDLTQFKEGDVVEVSAISKGKGFQGVVKRHGFGGGPRTHGQKHSEREPGSIGGGLRNKVPKKMRMAGRMGSDRITVKNLKVVHVDSASNTLYISGAIPGRKGTLVEITG
ncbi:MAG: large subunit ribosomal protein [Patescibacteria group bacterium]|nr:large subunit ribosomal protein [Patescibacteria group bacterium]